jgi:alanine dehydrogenase
MRIGVPKEIKVHEYRVGLVPASVRELTGRGHEVIVETGAGAGIGCGDEVYRAAGAAIAPDAAGVFKAADMVVKVKEPQPHEIPMLREGQVLFTYLHLAPDPEQTKGLLQSGCTAIAYETVTGPGGTLPLLQPMSEVAGRLAAQVAARYLEKPEGGAGILLGGVPGVSPARAAVLGAGNVGGNAMRMLLGLGARVTVVNKTLPRLIEIEDRYGALVTTRVATVETIEESVIESDLVIGAVLVAGAAAPKLVTRDMVRRMREGSVIVDVAIDQGGCCETSRPTTHADPVYTVDGVTHYCVANMPGAVPRTSAFALNNATLPFVLALAEKGWRRALAEDPGLMAGLNVHAGRITNEAVARSLRQEYVPAEAMLSA